MASQLYQPLLPDLGNDDDSCIKSVEHTATSDEIRRSTFPSFRTLRSASYTPSMSSPPLGITDTEEPKSEPYSDDEQQQAYSQHDVPSQLTLRPRLRNIICVLVGTISLLVFMIPAGLVLHKTFGLNVPLLDTAFHRPPTSPSLAFRKALVLSSYQAQNVTWLQQVNVRPNGTPDLWEVYRYVADATDGETSSDILKVDNPDGREPLAYLTYIIDHYADLPDMIVFAHGHERSFHQPTPLEYKLWALNTTALYEQAYFSIRCKSGRCDEGTKSYYDGSHGTPDPFFMGFWKAMMEETFGSVPASIGRIGMAQFAVHKAAILRLPITFWIGLREPLLKGQSSRYSWRDGKSGYFVGIVYENVWHILMGKEPETCPAVDVCNTVYFSNKIRCDKEPGYWSTQKGWEENSCDYYEEGLPEGMPSIGPKNP